MSRWAAPRLRPGGDVGQPRITVGRAFTEQFACLTPFNRHVTLGFYHGGGLDDPAGLLRSGGTQAGGKVSMRSLRLASLDEVRVPELRTLVTASTRHVVSPPREPRQ